MESVEVIDIAREGVWVLLKVGAPMMLTALIVGFAISLIQALTQVQENTLSFVPKMVAMLLVMIFTLPFMVQSLEDYGTRLFDRIATIE